MNCAPCWEIQCHLMYVSLPSLVRSLKVCTPKPVQWQAQCCQSTHTLVAEDCESLAAGRACSYTACAPFM